MTHQHLSLQCLHSLKGNAHDDDDRGTADSQVTDTCHQVACYDGQQSDDTQINGTKDNDLVDNLLDELSGGLAGTEAGDETAVLLQVVGDLHGIILNGGVEPAEEEDHQTVHNGVNPGSGGPDVLVPPAVQTEEGADGSRHGADGLGEDDGHNTGHGHLDGQVGVLAAVDLTANHALCVLDGNAALCIIDEDDEQDQSSHADQHDDDLPATSI